MQGVVRKGMGWLNDRQANFPIMELSLAGILEVRVSQRSVTAMTLLHLFNIEH